MTFFNPLIVVKDDGKGKEYADFIVSKRLAIRPPNPCNLDTCERIAQTYFISKSSTARIAKPLVVIFNSWSRTGNHFVDDFVCKPQSNWYFLLDLEQHRPYTKSFIVREITTWILHVRSKYLQILNTNDIMKFSILTFDMRSTTTFAGYLSQVLPMATNSIPTDIDCLISKLHEASDDELRIFNNFVLSRWQNSEAKTQVQKAMCIVLKLARAANVFLLILMIESN